MKEVLIISLVCWNIQYGKNFEGVLSSLQNNLGADIYVLQEVDKDTKRARRDVAEELAAGLNSNYIWSKEFQELAQARGNTKAYTGQAVLSRHRIELIENLYFKHQPASWSPSPFHPRSWLEPRRGKRMAQILKLYIGDEIIIIANTHLESNLPDRKIVPQMTELVEYLNTNYPEFNSIVAGDLNTSAGSDSPVLSLLEKNGFKNASAKKLAGKSLDWIFYRGNGLSVLDDLIIHKDIKASDHYPLQVKIKITPP